jgi:hypothetical protein
MDKYERSNESFMKAGCQSGTKNEQPTNNEAKRSKNEVQS